MGIKNTTDTYGSMAKFFHWSIAFIMLALILVGFYMSGLERSPFRGDLYFYHKSFGVLVLWLVGLRILWRLYNKPPVPHDNHQQWEKGLAKITHVFLYIAMVGMPLSGWLMSSAGGHSVSLFGLEMPSLIGKNPEIGKQMHRIHGILPYVLTGAITLHAIGALKHHYMDRDSTLKRMVAAPIRNIAPPIIVFILIFFLIIFAALAVF
jgi:cytochrome b561